MDERRRVQFDAFDLDLRSEELRKHGRRLRLPRQSFQVLALLLERPGELVTREQLCQRIWPADTFVDFEHGLNAVVNRLREVLGDSADAPRFIETLPKRGYRFVAQIATNHPPVPASPGASDAAPASELPAARWLAARSGRLATIAVVALAIGTAGVWWRRSPARPTSYAIAVLPLTNLARDGSGEYFSDGLTDELIRDLSTIEGLEVKSRTSSFVFKGRPRDVREVGRQLHVNLVLEGSVLRSENHLRVDVALVRVDEDSAIWSRRYDTELSDVFSVQDEIARSIVNELRLKQVGGRRRYNINLEAYDLYLRAQMVSKSDNLQNGLDDALVLYRQVIAKDNSFAPAYAGLALAYERLRLPRNLLPDAVQQMRDAADRAIELDPLLAEAHAAKGVAYASDLSWADAEHEFQRALQLDPDASRIHEAFSMAVLLREGRLTEAIRHLRAAAVLDPRSARTAYDLAFVLLEAGHYDEALELCRTVITANPPFPSFARDPGPILQLHSRILWFRGNRTEAVATLERLGPASHGFLGFAYARLGRRGEAEALAAEPDPAAVRHQALTYAGLRDGDAVFDALHKLAAVNDKAADLFPLYPELAFLRDDQRMVDFRRERRLPWPPELPSDAAGVSFSDAPSRR
jgi:TolB-like protein/DNA-binding winged helix-turn-helix (wHTH) protein